MARRPLFPVAAMAAIVVHSFAATARQSSRSAVTPLAYEAVLQKTTSNYTVTATLTYDRGRFQEILRFPGTPGSGPGGYMLLYDGASPPIVWSCLIPAKTAHPDTWSIRQMLYREAQRDGVEAVRKRYGLPARAHIRPRASDTPPRPTVRLPPAREAMAGGRWRPAGTETVAGNACRVYESRQAGRNGAPDVTTRICVEPRTRLVLKQTVHVGAMPGTPAPPVRETTTVIRFKVLDRVPAERFRIPAGFTAVVPRLLKDVRLPPGVRRKPATGPWAATGIAYQ